MKSLFRRSITFSVLWLACFGFSTVASAELNCNVGIEFYPSGGVKRCNLNGNHRIYTAQGQALTCADGHMLVQYPDGKLKSCTIAVPFAFDSIRCDALTKIELDSAGKLKKCERLQTLAGNPL